VASGEACAAIDESPISLYNTKRYGAGKTRNQLIRLRGAQIVGAPASSLPTWDNPHYALAAEGERHTPDRSPRMLSELIGHDAGDAERS
jgi:hypothetical protein